MKYYLLGFCVWVMAGSLHGQRPVSASSAQLLQGMQKLRVLGSVLYIAAHPDDENTRLLAYLANEKKYRTGYLSLTRGDGGQNLIGGEQGVELGMIRTQELLAARRIDGAEQFFTRAYDFGYSKNPQETFNIWNKDSVLADVVWVIRKFRPDILITRFPTTGEGGHGHHTGSAILAYEAFQLAGDPNRFPEQLKYVSVWQPKRILWNTFNFGGTNTTAPDQLKIDVGGYNTLLGISYGEMAAASRSQHKSQGFGVPATRGESVEYFKTTGGTVPAKELMEGVDVNWSRLDGAASITPQIDHLIESFDPLHPDRSIQALLGLQSSLISLPNNDWVIQKRAEVDQLILQCAGLYAEAIATQPAVALGDTLRFNVNLIARSVGDIVLRSVQYGSKDTVFNRSLEENKSFSLFGSIPVSLQNNTTQPYWLRHPMEKGRFVVSDPLEIGKPENDPAFSVRLNVVIRDQSISLLVPVVHKLTDPVRGEVFKALIVRPLVELDADEALSLMFTDRQSTAELKFRLQANQPFSDIRVLAQQAGQSIDLGRTPAMEKGQILRRGKSLSLEAGDVSFYARDPNGKPISSAGRLTRIEYDHIPELHYFKPTVQRIRSIDLHILGKRVGYIPGAGDKIPEALEQMGYEVTPLTEKELSKYKLSEFDAIITGVRAYNTHGWLNDSYDKLMDYVKAGGNLIVQYNTSNQIGPVRAKIGPFPFQITRNRVTDEQAAVGFLLPQHPALNRPNKLGPADFDHWVQERSIYHGLDTAGHFQKLLASSDAGEKSDDGSLMIAPYGKGWFTYTGLSLFRQLPAGVTGAYRLLANLIALHAKPNQ